MKNNTRIIYACVMPKILNLTPEQYVQHQREYQQNYYQRHKEELKQRARQRYELKNPAEKLKPGRPKIE